MKIKISNKKKIILLTILILIIFSAAIFIIGKYTFLKKSADVVDVNNVNLEAVIVYQDSAGNSITERTESTVRKVSPLRIEVDLKGKITDSNFKVSFVDPAKLTNDAPNTIVDPVNNVLIPDWTSISGVDPTIKYDLRVSAPGFLSRRLTDISLLEVTTPIVSSALVAGDVNQDGKINWQDYSDWKAAGYGQKVINDPRDFNGDGVIDWKDYGMSFGTRCFNANEINQDEWCKQ